ncbi:MAG: DUF3524 domain-containing protein [Deltaproteobacteria bacterium]|nr:DUF3524 domain-containing protein [Deltaproteobacteria bacterium]
MKDRLSLCIAETWFGESHETLFSGIAANSGHECRLVTLPARKWRWRMRFGAAHLAIQLDSLDPRPDALLVSDYVNLPVLRGLCPRATALPTAIYFLENQLTYPARKGSRGDFEFMAINVLSCLAANRCVFCSKNQLEAMLAAIPEFLRHDPDANSDAVVSRIADKSEVIPIGVDLESFDRARSRRPNRTDQPLHIVWPHRFEHDKNPDDFFEVLLELAAEGLPFMVSVLGQSYRDLPDSIAIAKERLEDRIVRWGFLKGSEYADALAAADVVVSTAWQETQGIAIIEAIRAGCDPLLPDRLSYPELLGPRLSDKHLYSSKGDLRRRLRWMMRHPDRVRAASNHWREMERFGWPTVAPQFDELVRQLHIAT